MTNGRRPVYGGTKKFQEDPHWRDHILFYEYFHGDNGAGLGASHQTGWTGLVAKLIQLFGSLDANKLLEAGKSAAFARWNVTDATRDDSSASHEAHESEHSMTARSIPRSIRSTHASG